MSGGSYNYKYLDIQDTYVGEMYDNQLNEMINDLTDVLHDLEWWRSCDIGEEDYRNTVTRFKRKWFKKDRLDIEKYINEQLEEKKRQLLIELQYMKGQ